MMDIQDLLKTATTDGLYHLLADTLTVLRTRGDVTIDGDRISMEFGEVYRKDDGITFGPCYYAEGSADLAMEERDPPLLTVERVADDLGMTAKDLTAFLEQHKADMIKTGNAHYEGETLIIDGAAG